MRESEIAAGDPHRLVPLVCALPIAAALVVAIQRVGTPTASWAVPLGLATALPWAAAALGLDFPRWPGVVFLLGATAALVWYPVPEDAAPFQLLALVAVTVLVGSSTEAIAVWAAAVFVMAGAEIVGPFDGSTIWILGISLGALGAYAVKAQDRVQSSRMAQAAVEERQRIARELHDVVAHSLAVTMLNLTGARLALRRDPAEADAALRQAEESGRQSLADIRRAVGLLGDNAPLTSLPAAADIDALVREFSDAGLRVTVTIEGDLSSVPPATGLALYRIAQESMANVVRHTPGSDAVVDLSVRSDLARLTVGNSDSGSTRHGRGDGIGIAGMRERAALVGGTLEAGAHERGWLVVAELPDRGDVIRVLLVDDQALIREGLRHILHPDDGFAIVGECDDGDQVIDAIAEHHPDVVVMDIRMRRVDGVEATRRVRALDDGPPILVLTTFDDDEILSQALRAGAAGFQLKDAPGEELIMATATVAGGESWLDPAVTACPEHVPNLGADPAAADSADLDRLTPRELEVLRLMARGASNSEIAEELFVGEVTVKSHIGHIFTKLGLRDRANAIVFAFDAGLVTPST